MTEGRTEKSNKLDKLKDHLWKGGMDTFFQYAIEYFLEDYAHEFDFSEPIVALDTELAKLYPDNEARGRIADKLGRLKTIDGFEQWVLLHTEIQGTPDPEFNERMFDMYIRIYDRFKKDVISLAVLTDKSDSFKPGKFTMGRAGTSMVFEYNTFKLKDKQPSELIKGKNPFGFMLLAAYYHIYGGNTDEEKYKNKISALRLLFAAGLPKDQTRKLSTFIIFYTQFDDRAFMSKLDQQFKEEFQEEMKTMTIEEVANWYLEESGREQGRTDEKHEVAKRMLAHGKPLEEITLFTGLSKEEIDTIKP